MHWVALFEGVRQEFRKLKHIIWELHWNSPNHCAFLNNYRKYLVSNDSHRAPKGYSESGNFLLCEPWGNILIANIPVSLGRSKQFTPKPKIA
jgi:hypothetical protein